MAVYSLNLPIFPPSHNCAIRYASKIAVALLDNECFTSEMFVITIVVL